MHPKNATAPLRALRRRFPGVRPQSLQGLGSLSGAFQSLIFPKAILARATFPTGGNVGYTHESDFNLSWRRDAFTKQPNHPWIARARVAIGMNFTELEIDTSGLSYADANELAKLAISHFRFSMPTGGTLRTWAPHALPPDLVLWRMPDAATVATASPALAALHEALALDFVSAAKSLMEDTTSGRQLTGLPTVALERSPVPGPGILTARGFGPNVGNRDEMAISVVQQAWYEFVRAYFAQRPHLDPAAFGLDGIAQKAYVNQMPLMPVNPLSSSGGSVNTSGRPNPTAGTLQTVTGAPDPFMHTTAAVKANQPKGLGTVAKVAIGATVVGGVIWWLKSRKKKR